MFELSIFPDNLPLPSPKTSARLIAGFVHFIHMCIRITHWQRLTDEEMPWVDYLDEHRGTPWFDWVRLFLSPQFEFKATKVFVIDIPNKRSPPTTFPLYLL